jgi:RNA ligase
MITTYPKLENLLDKSLLEKHIQEGIVNVQRHRTLPLRILNYTHRAQHENIWDGVTRLCRGLIVDDKDVVVARPFKKFWNLNTAHAPESMEENLPLGRPTVLEKLDGSLGIFYGWSGWTSIATRGSFHSPQADWANEWLLRHELEHKGGFRFPEDYTPLFEIIYPENRIVCNYTYDGLVLLGFVHKATGYELPHATVTAIALKNGLLPVDEHHGKSIAELIASPKQDNREGYVVSYHTSHITPPVKVKIKFDDYVRLHRIVTGMNTKSVWEMLSNEGSVERLLDGTPQHFRDWLSRWVEKLENEHGELVNTMNRVFLNRPFHDTSDQRGYRKACAEYFKAEAPHLTAPLFKLLDGDRNGAEMAVWKMIKPKCNEQDTFRKDGE